MSSTIRPKTPCVIKHRTSEFDGHGRPTYKTRARKTKCAIVSLYDKKDRTTVRADSSASRGKAEESLAVGRILLKPYEDISTGDVVEIMPDRNSKTTLNVTSIFRRVDINGKVHHIDVEGEIWVSE